MKMRKSNRQSAFDIGFDVVSTILLVIALLIVLYPLYFVVIASTWPRATWTRASSA